MGLISSTNTAARQLTSIASLRTRSRASCRYRHRPSTNWSSTSRTQRQRAIAAFGRGSGGGLIVTGSALANLQRNLIIRLAARYKLPAVYLARYFVADGGLMSYGPDPVDGFRRAASYVDRILKGEKPADLPVQAPTKNELVINLKTAKALGLQIPPTLFASADEVIE